MNDLLQNSIQNGIHRLPVRVYYEDTDFSGYQPTAFVEPTVDDQGAKDERRGSDTESDDDPPQDHEMPGVGHHGRQAGADRDQS